jgi:hypothetical protein
MTTVAHDKNKQHSLNAKVNFSRLQPLLYLTKLNLSKPTAHMLLNFQDATI